MNRSGAVLLLAILLLCAQVAAQQKAGEASPASSGPRPVSYGLVVDNSGSFRLLLDRVINLASEIIKTNELSDEAFLVTFASTEKIVLRQELTDRKADLEDAVQNMFIEGGQTAIIDAVKSAADYLVQNSRDEPGRARAIVLVTDGEDRASRTRLEDLIKDLKAGGVRVIVIAISSEKVFSKIPERLAKETGGIMLMPRTKAELAAAVRDVTAALRSK